MEAFKLIRWLQQHGKAPRLSKQKQEADKIRMYFDGLDLDKSGAIDLNEVKVSLFGLGLVNSMQEVEQQVDFVDVKGSGEVEFNEFLRVILRKKQQLE